MTSSNREELVITHLSVGLWTGRKKVRPGDLGLKPEDVPGYLTLGHKKTVDPGSLADFGRLKKEAERYLHEFGINMPFGTVVPRNLAVEAARELTRIQSEYETSKQTFLAHYESHLANWISQYPEYKEAIKAATVSKGEVSAQLNFRFQMFKVMELESVDASESALLQGGFREARKGLFWKLIEQACEDAEAVGKSLMINEKSGQRTLRPLKSLVAKIKGLSFLDSRLMPMAAVIENVLVRMPKLGYLENQDIQDLRALLSGLSDPEEVVRKLDAGESILVPLVPSEEKPELVAVDEAKKDGVPTVPAAQPATGIAVGAFVF